MNVTHKENPTMTKTKKFLFRDLSRLIAEKQLTMMSNTGGVTRIIGTAICPETNKEAEIAVWPCKTITKRGTRIPTRLSARDAATYLGLLGESRESREQRLQRIETMMAVARGEI